MTFAQGAALPGVRRVAVVGGGAAGLFSASLLAGTYDVTLIERDRRIGGHAHAVTVPDGPDAGLKLDAGFINCAHSAYPRLFGYFAELGIETALSDSSFCVYSEATGEHYFFAVGGQGQAEPDAAFDVRLFKYLDKLARFYSRAATDLAAGALAGLTVGAYCDRVELPREVIERFIVPVYASLWAIPPTEALELSAESIYTFYRRVGLPSFKDYNARYVKGSSQTYVDAMLRRYRGQVRLGCGVERITREGTPELRFEDGSRERFDAVVVAVHADRALALLADPSPTERALLGPWRYADSRVVVHSDPAVIPGGQRRRAAWNYLARARPEDHRHLTISYYLNRIMALETAEHYFVTSNPAVDIAPRRILLDTRLQHAIFSVDAVATQKRLAELQGGRGTYFCGSYFSCGSHEDAVSSAEAACAVLGVRSTVRSWEAAP